MERKQDPARHLSDIYSVVAALALTVAVGRLFGGAQGSAAIVWAVMPSLLAFIVTLVPFYHGALRYFEDTYGRAAPPHERWHVVWDFGCLFVEACVLVGAANLVANQEGFAIALAILLLVDVVWISVGSAMRLGAPRTWAYINLTAIPFVIGVWSLASTELAAATSAVALLVVAVMRTVADYWMTWDAYFGEGDAAPEPQG